MRPIHLVSSALILLGSFLSQPANATCSYSLSSLTNGTTADATPVMGNFNYILQCPNFTGPVGIGVASPSSIFHIVDTNGGTFFDGSGSTYNRFKSTTATASVGRDLMFTTSDLGTAPNLYIAHSGSVGVGTASPSAIFHVLDTNGGMFFDGSGSFWNRIKSTTNTAGVGRSLLFTTQNSGTTADLYISSTGNIGIGTDAPAQKLVVLGTIRQTSCTTAGTLSANASGDIICTSDARLKNVLGVYTDGLKAIGRISPRLFTYKPTKANPVETFVHAGFIAQDVRRVIPQAVAVQRNGYLSLDTTAILAASVNAIKELKAANDMQAAELATLRAQNAAVISQLRQVSTRLGALERVSRIRTAENRATSSQQIAH